LFYAVCYRTHSQRVGFEVVIAASMKIANLWVVTSCSLVEVYQCFRGTCYLHSQGSETLVKFYQTRQHINPEDSHLHTTNTTKKHSSKNEICGQMSIHFMHKNEEGNFTHKYYYLAKTFKKLFSIINFLKELLKCEQKCSFPVVDQRS
jgi:hypothetical protein